MEGHPVTIRLLDPPLHEFLPHEDWEIDQLAKDMGMTYIKALSIIKNAEEKLKNKLLEKSIGGLGGGGSKLTPFGQHFVYEFCVMEEKVKKYTLELMDAHFPMK